MSIINTGSKYYTLGLWFLIVIVLIWMSIGFFPIINLESDSALFSSGCEYLWQNNIKLPPDYFYEWDMQPLTGLIVVFGKYLFPLFSAEQIYNLLTICFTLIYFFIASFFVSRLVKIRWEYIFFILLLFPESYSIGYYSNTTIFASLFVITGFLLILKKPVNLFSILLLGLAPLLRVDVVVIYPVVLFLFWREFNFKRSVFYSCIYAISVIIISTIGFSLLKANPLSTFNYFVSIVNENAGNIDIRNIIKIHVAFYPVVSIVMIIIGVIRLCKTHHYKLLFVALIPFLLLYTINRSFTSVATKHIQYLLPFVCILAAVSLKEIKYKVFKRKYSLLLIICILLIGQLFIGLKYFPESKPWISKSYSAQYSRPTIATLYSRNIEQSGNLEIVIGSGQIIPTADEFMLLSGNFFTPFYWRNLKNAEKSEREILNKVIAENGDTLIFMTTQASDWLFTQQLYSIGFKLNSLGKIKLNRNQFEECQFEKENKILNVKMVNIERNIEAFNNAFHTFKSRPLYVVVDWDWQLFYINERKTEAIPISNKFSVLHNM